MLEHNIEVGTASLIKQHLYSVNQVKRPDNFLQNTLIVFGLLNAPATFQRLVNTCVSDVPNCTAFLDDLVVPQTGGCTSCLSVLCFSG